MSAMPGSDAMRSQKVIICVWPQPLPVISIACMQAKAPANRQRVAHSHIHIVKRHCQVHLLKVKKQIKYQVKRYITHIQGGRFPLA
jgi:hypothetical protein